MRKSPVAADIMTADRLTLREADLVSDAVRLLRARRVTGAPVLDDHGRPVGVISARDICAGVAGIAEVRAREEAARAVNPFFLDPFEDACLLEDPEGGILERPVSDVMTPVVIDVDAEAPIADVARAMDEWAVHRILVTREGRLAGIVSASDFVRLVARGALVPV